MKGGDGRGSTWLSGITALRDARKGPCGRLRGTTRSLRGPSGTHVCVAHHAVRGSSGAGVGQWKKREKRV